MKLKHLVVAGGIFALLNAAAIGDASYPSEPPPEILKAKENLKLSEQTRDRIAEEVAELKASGKASPELVAAYEVYLMRVQEIVIEHERLVARMEAALSAHENRSLPGAGPAAAGGAPSSGAGGEPPDRLKELDRRFNESLAAFDEMLLKELKLIQASSSKRMRGLTEAAAEAGRHAREKGEEALSEESAAQTETGASGGAASEKGRPGTEQARTSEGRGVTGEAAGADQRTGGLGSGGSGTPPGSYSSSPDDDIVARQLQEAAEKETDPELKAKLWKEYEAYKQSRAKP